MGKAEEAARQQEAARIRQKVDDQRAEAERMKQHTVELAEKAKQDAAEAIVRLESKGFPDAQIDRWLKWFIIPQEMAYWNVVVGSRPFYELDVPDYWRLYSDGSIRHNATLYVDLYNQDHRTLDRFSASLYHLGR